MTGTLKITESEQEFGYLYFGVNSGMEEGLYSPVTIVCGDDLVCTYSHRSQKYRIDGLTKIVARFPVGTVVRWKWYPKHHVVELL